MRLDHLLSMERRRERHGAILKLGREKSDGYDHGIRDTKVSDTEVSKEKTLRRKLGAREKRRKEFE